MNAVPFTRIPDAVLLDSRLTPVQFRIYAVIARRADRETASAFPSYATIARDANISRTSAINGVTALVSFGYLTKRPQESVQGDATSNLYTISGEGSQIFAPRRPALAIVNSRMVQGMNYGSTEFAPQVVQPVDHGGANSVPEPDSPNQRQKNKTQENRIAPAHTHEASAAAASPELTPAFSDFQENIGTLTAIVRQVIAELVSEFGAGQVRKAIQEAVIYEKRSLGYIRRVLSAWKRDGRRQKRTSSAQDAQSLLNDFMPTPLPDAIDLTWPPPDLLLEGHQEPPSNSLNFAADTWNTISECLPQFRRFMQCVTPRTFSNGLLVVGVSNNRVYKCLTTTQSSLIQYSCSGCNRNEWCCSFRIDIS